MLEMTAAVVLVAMGTFLNMFNTPLVALLELAPQSVLVLLGASLVVLLALLMLLDPTPLLVEDSDTRTGIVLLALFGLLATAEMTSVEDEDKLDESANESSFDESSLLFVVVELVEFGEDCQDEGSD